MTTKDDATKNYFKRLADKYISNDGSEPKPKDDPLAYQQAPMQIVRVDAESLKPFIVPIELSELYKHQLKMLMGWDLAEGKDESVSFSRKAVDAPRAELEFRPIYREVPSYFITDEMAAMGPIETARAMERADIRYRRPFPHNNAEVKELAYYLCRDLPTAQKALKVMIESLLEIMKIRDGSAPQEAFNTLEDLRHW